MGTEIVVSDSWAAFLDEVVASGEADSRAAVVVAALDRYRRQRAADADTLVYAQGGSDPDLESLAVWAAAHPVDTFALDLRGFDASH